MSKDPALRLAAEVSATLADLIKEIRQRAAAQAAAQNPAPHDPVALLCIAQRLVDQRQRRHRFFPDEIFHEPAWNMLLTLFIAYQLRQTLNTKALVSTAGAPVTTSQRWIEHLDKLGFVTRAIDPSDRRCIEVSLNDAGHQAVTRYLQDLTKLECE